MTPEERIDHNLERLMVACGSKVDAMRKVMREIMMESYTQGSNDCYKSMMETSKPLAANLQRFQDWRRGKDERTMSDAGIAPAEISRWIDAAIARLGGGK